ncbi:MAG: hypothetical protein ABEI74_04965 [Candidatus Pacearchaeota archaeon]
MGKRHLSRKSIFVLFSIAFIASLFLISPVNSKTICGEGSDFNSSETFSGRTYCCQSQNGSFGSCENCGQFGNESCMQFDENRSIDFISNCMACKDPSDYMKRPKSCFNRTVKNQNSLKSYRLESASYGVQIGQSNSIKKRELNVELLETSSDGVLLRLQRAGSRIFSEGEIVTKALKNGNPVLVENVDNPAFSKGKVRLKEIGSRCAGNTTTIDMQERLDFANSSSSLSIEKINVSGEYKKTVFDFNPGKNLQSKSLTAREGQSIFRSQFAEVSLMNIGSSYANLCVCGETDFSVERESDNFLGIEGLFIFDN